MLPQSPDPPRDSSILLYLLTVTGIAVAALVVHEDTTALRCAGLVVNLLILPLADRTARGLRRARAAESQLARSEAALRYANYELKMKSWGLTDSNKQLSRMATTDGLTGLANRRHLDETLARAVANADRGGRPLSVLLLDVDHFKSYNDTFGHPAGDRVLKGVAGQLQAVLRSGDLPARFGGEEFIAVLPGADAAQATRVAERLRRAIEEASWPGRPVTASLGVATLGPATSDAASLVAAADRALYDSKARGRNRVTYAEGPAPVTTTDQVGGRASDAPADHSGRGAPLAAARPVGMAVAC